MSFSVTDPHPWNPYHFPGSGSALKIGWKRDPYQIIQIRIQPKPLKTENNFNFLALLQ